MIVDHLMLRNFGAYRTEVQLDLSGKKIVGIVGNNEVGKSTLLRAICFAVFGKVPLKQDVHKVRDVMLINDNATSDLVVEVGLTLPTRKLTIQRGRTQDNTGFVMLDGKALKTAEAQEAISEAIRISYPDFTSLSYFVQGDMHEFMLGDKGAYFRRWTTSLRLWQSLSEAFKAEVGSWGTKRDLTTSKAASLALMVEGLEQARTDLKAAKRDLAAAQAKSERLSGSVSDISAQIKANDQTEKAKATVDHLRDQLTDLSASNSRMVNRLADVSREFKQIKSGTCPILNIKCKPLEKSGEAKRKELNKEIHDLKTALGENETKQKGLRAKGRKVVKQAKQDSGSHLRDDLTKARGELNTANRELQTAHSAVARAETRVEAAQKAKLEIKLCKKHLEACNTKIRRARFLEFMCGKSGIPTQIMETELEMVEDRCNWILERLDYSKRIKFAASKELAGFEAVCPACGSEEWVRQERVCKGCGITQPHKRKDEPSVTVWDGTRERPFALESGGGQTLQSFAVRLAGSLFVASMLGIDLRMVMLDEILAHLDAANRQKLMSLIIDKLSNEFGLQQQLVVSHHEDVVNAVDHILVVSKEQGSAIVRWD